MPNWAQVIQDIQKRQAQANARARLAVDDVRREYMEKLHKATGRNVIAYYSGWLVPRRHDADYGINDEDKNAFMMAFHGIKKADLDHGLDLILHTPGGGLAATESIVHYLRQKFGTNIRAIVPQIAMSAGTMLACCCKKIIMARHSNLGPIDPHLGGLPAHGVIQEFKRACKEAKTNPSTIPMWQAIIRQYPPGFISQCENAKKWASEFVQQQLQQCMFATDPNNRLKARAIVRKLSDFSGNRAHDRHVHFDECHKMGLDVELVEDNQELQELVLTVHHCYMHTLMNTSAIKIIESHRGTAMVKNVEIQPVR